MISGYSYVSDKVYKEIEELQKACNAITEGKQTLSVPVLTEDTGNVGSCPVKTIFVDRENKKIVSAISAFCDSETAEIIGMTHPDYRNKGYMKKLLNKLIRELERNGYREMYIVANAKNEEGDMVASHLSSEYSYSEYMMKVDKETFDNSVEVKVRAGQKSLVQNCILPSEILKGKSIYQNGVLLDTCFAQDEDWIFNGRISTKKVYEAYACKFHEGFYLYKVRVDENYRNKGLGKEFTKRFINLMFSEKFNAKEVYLQVGSYNKPAMKIYKELGFSPYEEQRYYYI